MQFEIIGAYRLGPRKADNKTRSVCITVATDFDASSIVKNRRYLKNSGITIWDFLSKEELDQQKNLMPKFREARERVRNGSKETVRFKRGVLTIDGGRVFN